MEQQLANVSMPLASIVFDLIQHCQNNRMAREWAAVEAPLCPNANGMHQCSLWIRS
jgi:hypothetical protein